MLPQRVIAAQTFALLLLAMLPTHSARGEEPKPRTWDAKAAAEYLDGRAATWLKWPGAARGQGTTCLSCHTSMPFALARPSLGIRLGETAAGNAEAMLIQQLKKRVRGWEQIVADASSGEDPFVPFYRQKRKPSALGSEAVLNALILVNYDVKRAKGKLSESTQEALAHLWQQQQKNGAWLWLDFGLRPWEQDSGYYGASLAAVAVGMAGKDYYDRADVQPTVALLKNYLTTQFAKQPLHHRVAGLWAASHLLAVLGDGDKDKLIAELWKLQEPDGGWSLAKLGGSSAGDTAWKSHGAYPTGTGSDGYATGLVVLAMKRAGVSTDHGNLKKAVGWLVLQQKEGTWPVHYINRARDPQDNIGKFMRDAATAFAVLALTD